MSQRAIDRFRPQPAPKPHPQNSMQERSQPPDAVEESARGNTISDSRPGAIVVTGDPLVHVVSVDWESYPAVADAAAPPKALIAPEATEPLAKTTITASETAPKTIPLQPRHQRLFIHTRKQILRGARIIGMPLIWVGVAAFCGGTGYAAFNWLSTIPPAPDCDRLWFFSTDADKLFCAEQAARAGTAESLQAGIKLVQPWLSGHQLQAKATRLHQDWSKQLLKQANLKALEDDLDQAIQLAEQIKPDNPIYRDAKNAILEWQKLRDRGNLVASTVEAAIKAQDWKKADAELQPRSSQISDFQQQQLNQLRERILTERMAFNQLYQVRDLVKAQPTVQAETLGRGIQLLAQINPNTYASAAAQLDSQQWRESLIKIAETRLQNGDLPGAIAAARWLPAQTALTPQIQELFWLSRAQQTLQQPHGILVQSAWQQITLLAALQTIQPGSPLAALAQSERDRLERQVQDLTQLSLASAVARVPQLPALQMAIQMAETITSDRPHRLEAQTLIAEWRKEIERVQDRPYLSQAQRLAKSNKLKDLQAAIAQASKIPLGRALRPQAQAAIFDWQQQIQTIEDKPTLAKARQLAQQNQLTAAIQEASKISIGRALYPDAQQLISSWTATIQTTADRPILDEASALATQGNFGVAIEIAYQIAPGRALYNEAQAAIAEWNTQLRQTRRSRRFDDER